MAWFYRDDFKLQLRVEHRAAQQEARFTGYALPLAGAVEIHAQMNFQFAYAGVEQVRIRVPAELAETFFFTGAGIAERRRDGDVWTIRFQSERSGNYPLEIRATIPSPADKDDEQRFHFRLPAIVPLDTARWSGVWAVEANTDTEIRFALAGANEADTLHAPVLTGYQPERRVIGVFEFLGSVTEMTIDLDGIRHPSAAVAAAVVDDLQLETVVSTSGVSRHQATILARVAGDGFFDIRLPENAKMWSLLLSGNPVKPVGGAASGVLRVELPGGQKPDAASNITVVYETPGQPWLEAGRRVFAAPTFPSGVPVLQSHWKLTVPRGFDYDLSRTPVGPTATAEATPWELLVPRFGLAVWRAFGLGARLMSPSYRRAVVADAAGIADPSNDARITGSSQAGSAGLLDVAPQPLLQQAEAASAIMPITPAPRETPAPTVDQAMVRESNKEMDTKWANPVRRFDIRDKVSSDDNAESAGRHNFDSSDRSRTDRLLSKVAGESARIRPRGENTETLETAEFKVPPDFLSGTGNIKGGEVTQGGRDFTGAGSGPLIARTDAKTFLESSGVTFPLGASATYLPSSGKLVVRNTRENIDLLSALTRTAGVDNGHGEKFGLTAKSGAIASVAGLLPLRVDLPSDGHVYEFAGGGEPGKLAFAFNDKANAAQGRWMFLTLGALAFFIFAAGWAHPWRRTLQIVLALTFFPLIIAPSSTVMCNALLAGWLWAVAGWALTRFLLRRPRVLPAALIFAASFLPQAARAETAPQRELVIVPYDDTKPANAQQPTQYYLPYDRFLTLWQQAKAHRQPRVPELPPGDARFTITSARYDARLDGESLIIEGTLDLQTYGDGGVAVPMNFGKAAFGNLTLDGGSAALDDKAALWVPAAGTHRVAVSLRLKTGPIKSGTEIAWNVPPSVATRVSVLLTAGGLRASVRGSVPDIGEVEEIVPEGRRLTASAGGTSSLSLQFRDTPPPTPNSEKPLLAQIDARLTAGAGQETVDAKLNLTFAGSTQNHFTVFLDPGLTLIGLDAPGIERWHLTTGGDRQSLEIFLQAPVRDSYQLTLGADRPLPQLPAERRQFPLVSADAVRTEQTAVLNAEGAVEIILPSGLPAGVRRVADPVPGDGSRRATAYAGSAMSALVYSVHPAAGKRTAQINYLYQISRTKIELAASLKLRTPGGKNYPLTADMRLPAGFTVQAVAGGAVRQWWQTGDALSLRFWPAPNRETIPVVVYLVRQFERAPGTFALPPMVLEGFVETTGETVIAANRAFKIGLTLPAAALSRDLSEIDPGKAAPEFSVKTPLERQRAYRYRGNFETTAMLEIQPEKWEAHWVTQASAHEGHVTLVTRVNIEALRGTVEAVEFRLPANTPEARVDGGTEVRETLPGAGDQDHRAYRVIFQNPLYAGGETSFTINIELPLGPEGSASFPALTFPAASATLPGGYLLVENASSGEMSLDAHGLEPAVEKDVPFLPPQIVAGTQFFRAAPASPWSLGLQIANLEKTSGRAALVAYAELTTTLRPSGEEWHRAVYHLQNRSLQFLPVELPDGVEFIGAQVAGESVRVDSAGGAGGKTSLLVPLLKTKPGELSYDVTLVYRRAVPKRGAWKAEKLFANWRLDDPKIPGIPVEKTLWNVYLPSETRVLSVGGNLQPVVTELAETEKLESALSDLRSLSATYNSATADNDVRQRALNNFNSLAGTVTRGVQVETQKKADDEGGERYSFLRKAEKRSQKTAVLEKQDSIMKELESLNTANVSAPLTGANTYTGSISISGGTLQAGQKQMTLGEKAPVLGDVPVVGQLFRQGWRDNRITIRSAGADLASKDSAQQFNATVGGALESNKPASTSQLALNDSLGVDLPAADAPATSEKVTAKAKNAVAKSVPEPQQDQRLSTARAFSQPAAAGGVGGGAESDSSVKAFTYPTQFQPPQIPNLAKPSSTQQPPAVEEEEEEVMPLLTLAQAESKKESLRTVGRISLAVKFPTEGQVYHFKKAESGAHLTLLSTEPAKYTRLLWLVSLAAGLGIYQAIRWTIRRMRQRWLSRRRVAAVAMA